MASYIEVHPDEEEESDGAQPSTSTCSGSKVRPSDSYNNKIADVSFDMSSTDCDSVTTGGHNSQNALSHQSKSNQPSQAQANHNSQQGNHFLVKPTQTKEYKEPEHGTIEEVREYDFCMKSPMSDGHIIDLRGREVLFAIGVFFFLSVSIGLIVVLATMKVEEMKQDKQDREKPGTCFTKECMARAAEMLSMMDTSASPCSDMWQYACGGWLKQAEIPPRETSWGVSKQIKLRINKDVLRLLEADVHTNTTTSAERKMKIVYKHCMDVDALDDIGTRPIIHIMDQVGGWAIFEDWNLLMKPGTWRFQDFLKELHHKYLIRVFFSMFVHPNDKGSGNMLQFDQSVLPYSDIFNPFMRRPELTQAYTDYLRQIVTLFEPPEERIDEFVNSTVQFESQLAEIHEFDLGPSMGNLQDNYKRMTVQELQTACPSVNWLDYIQATFPEIQSNTTILVTDKNFFVKLSTLLKNTEERVINYYMMWRLVDDFAANLPEDFRKAHQQFSLFYTGKTRKETREAYCVDMMGKMFGFELGASFVHRYFPPIDKYAVQNMIGHVRDSLHRVLNQSSWLVNTTKTEAMKKVKAMDFKVGYPDFIKEQNKVDEYYHTFSANEGNSFFQDLVSYYKHEVELTRLDLKGLLHAPEWIMQPYEVNAYTNPFDNTIVLPAGVLQSPHYDNSLPKYINYGSFGSVIGHEMMHAFDETGSMFDAEGIMRPWWDETSQAEYQDRLQCVSNYYSSLNYRNYKINGSTTQNENLADIEGLKVAYKAYHDNMGSKKEPAMPGLDLNNTQIFFLSFAQNYCKVRKPELIEGYLANSVHMIEEIRVKGTLAQVREFADVFGCRRRTKMNPTSRCSLWL